MIKAILFDLDGTLLNVDMDIFIGKYLQKLAGHFAHLIKPDDFTTALLNATGSMINDNNPNLTNKEVFMANFFTQIQHPPEDIMPLIDCFYEDVFPDLSRFTKPFPEVLPALVVTKEKGYQMVLATNPIFPRLAIEHRMSWAGIVEFPFCLVTSYEHMHFCKPNPDYYREIAKRLHLTPEECLMVGNDANDDIAAAGTAGMKTYLVENMAVNESGKLLQPDYRGKVEELAAFIESLN